MNRKNVIIYTSNNSPICNDLLNFMNEWNIAYEIKNVSENKSHMEELQGEGIFGTPTTFINNIPILGFQKSQLKRALSIDDNGHSEYFHR